MKRYHENGMIQLSQSAMEMLAVCPAKYDFACRYNRKDIGDSFRWGIQAHAILEGKEGEYEPEAIQYATSLHRLAIDYDIRVDEHEVTQTFEIMPGIMFKRIIDGIGYWGLTGEPVLIDWKTAERVWMKKTAPGGGYFSPKAMTFQAVSYLIPADWHDWPQTIVFIVGEKGGNGNIYPYHITPEDVTNLDQAIITFADIIRNERFYKVRGFGCGQPGTRYVCPFYEACYKLPGWELLYDEEVKEEEVEV
jgi:hypothetical protein